MYATAISDSPTERDLIRQLRTGLRDQQWECMPESVAWQAFLELRKRGVPRAEHLFISALKSLHLRRSVAGVDLSVSDSHPDEHRMVDDAFLGDLWKAYKKCIRFNRTGPASQLLRDIEEQLNAN